MIWDTLTGFFKRTVVRWPAVAAIVIIMGVYLWRLPVILHVILGLHPVGFSLTLIFVSCTVVFVCFLLIVGHAGQILAHGSPQSGRQSDTKRSLSENKPHKYTGDTEKP